MTKAEWLKCRDPKVLLNSLGRKPSKRKRRLFGCACCHRIWSLIPDDRCRAAVVTAEQFADDAVDSTELAWAKSQAKASYEEYWQRSDARRYAAEACYRVAFANADDAARAWTCTTLVLQMYALAQRGCSFGQGEYRYIMGEVWDQEQLFQAGLLRDIFGNPFGAVTFYPSWRTETAIILARQMYESREFSVLPILADALQDAGCDNEDILNHCRGPGPHVRGCWVADIILRKQ